ncbi:hypothetical protein V2J09_007948 [Rumex salicifolius]
MADVVPEKPAVPTDEPVVAPEPPAVNDCCNPESLTEPACDEENGTGAPKVCVDDAEKAGSYSPSPPLICGSFRAVETLSAGKGLPENEKVALEELKQLVREALPANELLSSKTPEDKAPQMAEEGKESAVEKADESDSPPPADLTLEDETNSSSPPLETAVEKRVTEEEKTVTKEAVINAVDEDGANCRTVEAIEETVVPSQLPLDSNNGGSQEMEVVSIWGIPLLEDERSDVVLWKFLRARDFKVKEAFAMLKSTLQWRKQFGIDEIDEEQEQWKDLEDKVVFMHGLSKEGHPICYNVYGEFNNKKLYQKTFSDEDKRQGFLRWRIRFLERSIRKLDFRPGGVSTIVQVNDLKDSPGIGKSELRQATNQALHLLQDNYPELVAKQVFINVPWWYMAVHKMISPFLTQRTKSKFVFAGPSKTAETLFNYIAAEQVPVQYGGLSREGEFSESDPATHILVKPSSKETVEFSVTEACQLTWEVRVLGWEVSYGAEFVPNAEESYTVIIQKMRKISVNGEGKGVISNSFKVGEPGKVILTIHNSSSKKKRLLYRLKSKPFSY